MGLLQQDPTTLLTLASITLETLVPGQVGISVPPTPLIVSSEWRSSQGLPLAQLCSLFWRMQLEGLF